MVSIHRRISIWVAMVALLVIAAGAMFAGSAAGQGSTVDYDIDNDGLIDVSTLAQLNAMRWDTDGNGVAGPSDSADYVAAFPNPETGMGCPDDGCKGYELTADLDFDTNDDGRTDIVGDTYWNNGSGWTPIGTYDENDGAEFNTIFDGNGHTISNLFISGGASDYLGLFGYADGEEENDNAIRNVKLENARVNGSSSARHVGLLVGYNEAKLSLISATGSVTGGDNVGGLVGANYAPIEDSYSSASVSGRDNVGGLVGSNDAGELSVTLAAGAVTGTATGHGTIVAVGGLVGSNATGPIVASYATGAVTATITGDGSNVLAGGLVGINFNGSITNTYAIGAVSGTVSDASIVPAVGGLLGSNASGTITDSYWDTQTSGQTMSAGGTAKTTAELQAPTSHTGIYASWSAAKWDFGGPVQYPALKIDFDGDGTRTALEVGSQRTDYDTDDNGLIEVATLAQFDAMRWDLNGSGDSDKAENASKYLTPFPKAAIGMGCPHDEGCRGYELTADLDFDTNDDGRTDIVGDTYWNNGSGWTPIGTYDENDGAEFNTIFDGNGHTISNLFISGGSAGYLGLFGYADGEEENDNAIRNVKLENARVSGPSSANNVGLLVGFNKAKLSLISATGSVTGGDNVGGLVGANDAPIEDSYSGASVSGGNHVGGLVGNNQGGGLTVTLAAGAVTGTATGNRITVAVGGLVGSNDAGPIEASYATGAVTATVTGDGSNVAAGGLVGSNFNGSITNAYAIGAVSGTVSDTDIVAAVGGLLGSNDSGTITDSYWDTQASGQAMSAGGTAKTTAELQAPTSATGIYASWSAAKWDFGGPVQYPALKIDFDGDGTRTALEVGSQRTDYDTDDNGLIEVATLAQFDAMRWDLNGSGDSDKAENATKYLTPFPKAAIRMGCPHDEGCRGYELTADLDFDTNDDGRTDIAGDAYWNNGSGWIPIGTYDENDGAEFNTIFDGNGHTISNLFISGGASGYLGLFGAADGEEENENAIRNVKLENARVSGPSSANNVGLLVGFNKAKLSLISATGSATGGDNVGGLVGANDAPIEDSYSGASVSGGNHVGGLVGNNQGGELTFTLAAGAVTGTATRDRITVAVGGLVGSNDAGPIEASYATGAVTATATGAGSNVAAGGLVGSNFNGSITNTYAIGAVSGTVSDADVVPAVGGLLGSNDSGTITDSYWDTQASGQAMSAGGTAKTTAELQAPTSHTGIYGNWNADADRWEFGGPVQYPALKIDFDGDGTRTALEVGSQRTDYDTDDDGLIEVATLAQFDAMRWDLNGSGDSDQAENATKYLTPFPKAAIGMGCPDDGCKGYELTADLDFDTNDDSRTDIAGDTYWNNGVGWAPIWSYSGVLEGNGHAIDNLYINRTERGRSGLFSRLTDGAIVRNLGLTNVNITSNGDAGAFAGLVTRASISNSYATGSIDVYSNGDSVGGFVGEASGHPSGKDTIRDSYSLVNVTSTGVGANVGGLAGSMHVNQSSTARIINSFAAGAVQARYPSRAGGLVGHTGIPGSKIDDSYWDSDTTGWLTSSDDGDGNADDGLDKTKQELQSPTSATGIYSDWSSTAWDFGTATQYPALKYDTNGDGTATVAEFGTQPRSAPNFTYDLDLDDDGLVEVLTLAQLNAIRWDANGDGVATGGDAERYAHAFASWRTGLPVSCVGASCQGYELVTDLTFDTNNNSQADSGDAYWNGGAGWYPIGSYTGVLEGNGRAISNLYLNRTGRGSAGLFGKLTGGADVRNLGLQALDITAGGDAGAFAGLANRSSIRNSYATGKVTGNGDDTAVGGLVGEASGHPSERDTIRDSYSLVKVTSTGDDSSAGGLVGTLSASGTNQPWIANSYAAGLVQTTEPALGGGLVGAAETDYAWVSHSYWDRETSGWDTSAVGGGQSKNRLQSNQGIYHRWSSEVWDFGSHSQYPALKHDTNGDGTATSAEFGNQTRTAAIPAVDLDKDNDGLIELGNRDQLSAVRWDLDGDGIPASNGDDYWNALNGGVSSNTPCVGVPCHGYELTADIDLGWDDNEWESIGQSYEASYNAEFNGNGHTISNLWQSRVSGNERNSHVGLFGFTGRDALIHGVILNRVDIEVWGSNNSIYGVNVAGALVAVNQGVVRNSAFEKSNCDVVGRNVSGGLVGSNHGTVEQSWADCHWVKSLNGAGGLVGINHTVGTVRNSYVGGSTIAYNPRDGWYKGALVGRNWGTVDKSYSLGKTRRNDDAHLGPMNGQQIGAGVTTDSYFLGKESHEDLGGNKVSEEALKWPQPSQRGAFSAWNTNLWDLGDSTQHTVLRVDTNGDGYATTWELGGQRPSDAFGHRPDYANGDAAHSITRGALTLRFSKADGDEDVRVDGVGYRIAKTGEACHDWFGNSVVMMDETNGRATLTEEDGVYTLDLDRRDTWAFRPNGRVCVDVWFINTEGEKSDARRWHDIHMPGGEAPRSKPIKKAEAIISDGSVALWFETNPYDRAKSVGYRIALTGDACEGWTGGRGPLSPGEVKGEATLNEHGGLWRLGLQTGPDQTMKPNVQYCVEVWTINDYGAAPSGRGWQFVTGN